MNKGGNKMPRVNLSIDDDLYDLLKKAADIENCTINVHIISVLEKLYKENPFDYKSALQILIEEAKSKRIGEEFTLFELPSFSEISVVKAEKANIKSSMVRARLGKLFNAAVVKRSIPFIERAKKENGELKFYSRAAVYVRRNDY